MIYFSHVSFPSLLPLEWIDPRVLVPGPFGDETLFLATDKGDVVNLFSGDRLATRSWLLSAPRLKKKRDYYEIYTDAPHGPHGFGQENVFFKPRRMKLVLKVTAGSIDKDHIKCADTFIAVGRPRIGEIEVFWKHADCINTFHANPAYQCIHHFRALHSSHALLKRLAELNGPDVVLADIARRQNDCLAILGSHIPGVLILREHSLQSPLDLDMTAVREQLFTFIGPQLRARLENLAPDNWPGEIVLDSTSVRMRFRHGKNLDGAIVKTSYRKRLNTNRCPEHETLVTRLIENAQPELFAETNGKEACYELPLITDSGCIKLANDADDFLAVMNHYLRAFLTHQDKIDRVLRLCQNKEDYPLGTIRKKGV